MYKLLFSEVAKKDLEKFTVLLLKN